MYIVQGLLGEWQTMGAATFRRDAIELANKLADTRGIPMQVQIMHPDGTVRVIIWEVVNDYPL